MVQSSKKPVRYAIRTHPHVAKRLSRGNHSKHTSLFIILRKGDYLWCKLLVAWTKMWLKSHNLLPNFHLISSEGKGEWMGGEESGDFLTSDLITSKYYPPLPLTSDLVTSIYLSPKIKKKHNEPKDLMMWRLKPMEMKVDRSIRHQNVTQVF